MSPNAASNAIPGAPWRSRCRAGSSLDSAESDASTNEFGVYTPAWPPPNTARDRYPRVSARLPEIFRKFGASGLMAMPSGADTSGAAADDVRDYLQGKAISGPDRVRLFKLAFDASVSSFAGRRQLYEYYFFGDPARMAGALVPGYDSSELRERVTSFLERGG